MAPRDEVLGRIRGAIGGAKPSPVPPGAALTKGDPEVPPAYWTRANLIPSGCSISSPNA